MRRIVVLGGLCAAVVVTVVGISRTPVNAADGGAPQAQGQMQHDEHRGPGGPGGSGAPGGPGGARGPGGPGWPSAPVDSFGAVRDSFVDIVAKQIAGKENEPAETVFKDIQAFKGVPAGRVLRAMDSFGHALGVNCTYCHDASDWSKSLHVEKNTCRDMMKMTKAINDEWLAKMADIKSEEPHVGCMTCHRGTPRPGARPAGMGGGMKQGG